MWVAAGSGGGAASNMLWSTDGKTWNASTNNTFNSIGTAVAWNGSLWVAAGNGGAAASNMLWSTDGKTWNASTNSTFSSYGSAVAWNGSLWVAAGNGGAAASNMLWSTDGKTWNASTGTSFANYGNAVAWNGSLWVAAGSGGGAAYSMMWSTDGKTWTASSNNAFSTNGYGVASALPLTTYAYGGGALQIVGGSSNLPTNVAGSVYETSGFTNTLGTITGTYSGPVPSYDATVYSFTSGSGTFVVPTGAPVVVDYLIVGGGGAGGNWVGGGGGAGGLVYAKGVQLPAGSYSWAVGAGGVGVTGCNVSAGSGSNSSLSNAAFGNVVAVGGGAGGTYNTALTAVTNAGSNGGSGGGGAQNGTTLDPGGVGAIGQGTSGGSCAATGFSGGGGGGGAGGVGTSTTTNAGGAGGIGLVIPITGSNVYYAGGGGGFGDLAAAVGAGGLGGGGAGVNAVGSNGISGLANTGAGGGGSGRNTATYAGGSGGSGIIIIRVYTNTGSRMLIGDGSGYSLALSAQSNAVTRDVMTVTDQGNVTIGLSNAYFNNQTGCALDASGNLYVADNGNYRVRKVSPSGIVTTVAGNGINASTNGTGFAAQFVSPYGIVVDTSTNIAYVAEAGAGTALAWLGRTIRAINLSTGAVTTIAGSNGAAAALTDAIIGTNARFSSPAGLAIGTYSSVKYLFVNDDSGTTATGAIRKINLTSGNYEVTTVGSNIGNNAGVAYDGLRYVYACRYSAHVIVSFDLSLASNQTAAVLAGSGTGASVDGSGTGASFNQPLGMCTDGTNLYVSDSAGNTIRKIVITGAAVTTLAGSNALSGSTDATGSAARFNFPNVLAIDSANSNLYIPDRNNNKIRKLNLATCNVTTYAGTGVAGFADGSVPTTTVVNNTLLVNSNVGINCNAPGYALDVGGNMKAPGYSVISTSNDLINGAPSYGMGTANFNILGYTGVGATLPLQIAHYYGIAFQAGASAWNPGAPTCVMGNGRVGINCNAPAFTLDVTGALNLYSNITGPFAPITGTSSNGSFAIGIAGGATQYAVNALTGDTVIRSAQNSLLLASGNGGNAGSNYAGGICISNSNVGINTNAPVSAYALDVNGAISTRGGTAQTTKGFINMLPADGTHTGFIEFWSSNAVSRLSYIGYATSTGMDISSSVPLRIFGANVSIGASATTPAYQLDVNGQIRATGLIYANSGVVYGVQTF